MKPTKLYIDVLWKHHYGDDPVGLVSELRSDRSELRKLGFITEDEFEAMWLGHAWTETVALGEIPPEEEI